MERKEIFAIFLAVVCVFLVIGALGMMRGNVGQEESQPDLPAVTDAVITSAETDIWDVIHNQNTTTTVTEVTDEMGNPVTEPADGTMTVDPSETDITEGIESELSDMSDPSMMTDLAESSETTAVTAAPAEEQQGGYTLFVDG